MKSQILTLAIVFFLFTSCFKTPPTEYDVSNSKVSLMITSKTTEEELSDIAEEIKKKKNIEIDFEESTFKSNGKIKHLDLKVDCNDGMSGTASASATELRVRPVGFIRDYASNSKVPFSIGGIFEEEENNN